MKCPHCSQSIARKSLDGKIKIRTSILVFTPEGKAEVVCKACGNDVQIDIAAGDSLRKSFNDPPLLIPKNR